MIGATLIHINPPLILLLLYTNLISKTIEKYCKIFWNIRFIDTLLYNLYDRCRNIVLPRFYIML